MSYEIIDQNFINHIDQLVKSIFPNLNELERDTISSITSQIIDLMAMKFGFNIDDVEEFYTAFTENNNQHIYSTIKMLFPFMDDRNNYILFSEIHSLKDITCKKKPGNNYSTDRSVNPYLISTFQYYRSYVHGTYEGEKEWTDDHFKTNEDFETYTEYEYSIRDLYITASLIYETLELSRTKLYVNWLDVRPLTLKNYKESRLYKNTFDIINNEFIVTDPAISPDKTNREKLKHVSSYNLEDLSVSENIMLYYRGITTHDMFNVFHVFLYTDIFYSGTKWLIYEKQIENGKRPKTYLEILYDIFPFNELLQPFETVNKIEMEEKWSLIHESTRDIDKNFIKCIMLKFDMNECTDEMCNEFNYDNMSFYRNLNEENKKNSNKRLDFEDEETFLDLTNIDINLAEYSFKVNEFKNKIPISVIFEFVSKQIEKFKKTWFGKNMITDDNKINTKISPLIVEEGQDKFEIQGTTYFITFKNIYNYAKIVSKNCTEGINTKGNVVDKLLTSRSLSDENWDAFMNILKNNEFRMHKVLIQTYGDKRGNETFKKKLQQKINENIKEIIFIVMIDSGLLSEWRPNSKYTDSSSLGDTDEERQSNIKKKFKKEFIKSGTGIEDDYLNSRYYLTGKKFKELDLYNEKKKEKVNWFEHTSENKWYYFFALSLLSQLTFNLHFLNNRVMLVTGATGQGKSVIMPILFYYASVALNLNLKTKVVSTQALVTATLSNSIFMASNLGVPISINDYETFSPFIQYSTQDKKHLVKNSETFIKEVTDRTLLEEIIKNPTLKQLVDKKKKIYSDKNIYDVVIIDEAHMHNISMDLILTLVKNTVLINNQIRLVITSATMEADEHIYKRYYRFLNNNFMYPITPRIAKEHLMYKNGTYTIDRNFIDLRFHISPPGEITRYIVKDIYLDKDTKSYEEAEAEGIKLVKKIIPSSTGDFLFFTTSTANVLKIARKLNEITPGHVIALPLYSQLKALSNDIKWFDIIKGIDKRKMDIEYDKNEIIDVIINGSEKYSKTAPGKYTQAIIVATNVVEASVTIDSLKYVIDTGYAVNVSYDSELNKDITAVLPIADASRMQRRGRVGRVSDGIAYYMYAKGARAHIKPEYQIVTSNIMFDIFKTLSSSSEKLVFDFKYHPQVYNFEKGVSKYNNFYLQEENKHIRNIYRTQYFCNFHKGTIDDYNPFDDESTVPIDNLSLDFPPLYEDGYGIASLIDKKGKFYLIHPGEIYIQRDVVTGSVDFSKMNKSRHSKKTEKIFEKLIQIKYIYETEPNKNINYHLGGFDSNIHKYEYIKIIEEILLKESKSFRVIGEKFSEETVVKIVKSICVGNMLHCVDDIIKIISLMFSISSYSDLIESDKDRPRILKVKEFVKKWKNSASEILVFLKIMDKFKPYYTKIEKIEKMITEKFMDENYKKFIKLCLLYGNEIFVKPDILTLEGITKQEIKIFTEAKNQRHNYDNMKDKFKEEIARIVVTEKDVLSLCKKLFIKPSAIVAALDMQNLLTLAISNEKIKESLEEFKNIYPMNITTFDPLIMTFLENFGSNVYKYDSIRSKFKPLLFGPEISKPFLSLTNIYSSYYFFIYSDRDNKFLVGLTPINATMIQATQGVLISGDGIRSNNTGLIEQDILFITSKSKITKKK